MIRVLPVVHTVPQPWQCMRRRISCAAAPRTQPDSRGRMAAQTLDVGALRLKGVSVGGVETCITVPSLSLAFDAGRGPSFSTSMRTVALTHGHCDHSIGLPLHMATRAMQRLPRAQYIVPPEVAADVCGLLNAVQKLEQTSLPYKVEPLGPADGMIEFRPNWFLKSFPTTHTIPSQGYILYERKTRLRDELRGLPGHELGQLRKKGVSIEDSHLSPELAFTGDTAFDSIKDNTELRRVKVLITEMTFIDDKCSVNRTQAFGHIHIDEVCAEAELFEHNQHVVFTHFSARYKKDCILKAMTRLPPALREKSVALIGS